jgi:hypothetical protein
MLRINYLLSKVEEKPKRIAICDSAKLPSAGIIFKGKNKKKVLTLRIFLKSLLKTAM